MELPRLTRPHTKAWVAIAIGAVLAVLIGLHASYEEGPMYHATFLTATVGAAIASWIGVARRKRAGRLPWVLIAAGVTLSAIGDSTEVFYKWLDGETPDISLADAGWIMSFVAIIAGIMLLEMRNRRARADVDGIIDAAAIGTVALLLVWQVNLRQTLDDQTLSPLIQAVWIVYPIFDVILLTLIARALISRRTRTPTAVLLAGGSACWLCSDFAYVLLGVAEGFSVWLNIGWMVGAVLLSAACWPVASEGAEGSAAIEPMDHQIGAIRVGFGISLLLTPQLLAFAVYVAGDTSNPVPLTMSTMVLAGLAFMRTLRILRAKDKVRAALSSSQRYYKALAANSSDAVTVLDEDGRVYSESAALAPMLGYEPGALSSDRVQWATLFADFREANALLARARSAPGVVFATQLRAERGGDAAVWLEARMVNLLEDPDVEGIVINVHDVTERKRAEDALSYQAFHDSLTGLANRVLFHDRVEHALQRHARSEVDPAVIYIDLDGFKNVNDSLGHDAGDALLREVASRLSTAVRAADTVARLGGDEFAVLVEHSDDPLAEASHIAQRILEVLEMPVQLGDNLVSISGSLGIAVAERGAESDALLRNADIAMYQAKTGGRGRWIVFDPSMRTAALERVQLESDLYGALEADQFRLVYQPVVELETQAVVGFEALLRWEHPTLGTVNPDRFIPIVEDTGLILPIGRWVLETACRQAAEWQQEFPRSHPITMAVNLSGRQLAAPELVDDVAEALVQSGLDPASLVLEMTETVLVKDPNTAAQRLGELRDLGVRLAIDDFGTGYSSLSYLRQFPVDILKIDRSFINAINERAQVPAIVRGLLDLGRTLELETVAEGIELGVQRDRLRDEHCDLGQGFLFARPMDPADAESLLEHLREGEPLRQMDDAAVPNRTR